MSFKQAAWTHGSSIQFQDKSWEARSDRQGKRTRVWPTTVTKEWVHFAIPTPAIINNTERLKAHSTIIRFLTGSQASIVAIHGHDGDKQIINRNNLDLKSKPETPAYRERFDGMPPVFWGVGIDICVNFTGTNENEAWIDFISVGVDFYL